MARLSIIFAILYCHHLILILPNCSAVEVNEPMHSESSDKVNVLFCCNKGEDLDKPKSNNIADIGCIPSNEEFHSFIYSPSEQDYLNEIPKSWSIIRGMKPTCAETLRYVPHSKFSPFLLIDDGSVILEVETGLKLEPEQFCLGVKTLLACMPRKNESHQAAATMRPKLRKCCGANAAYEKNSCIAIENEIMTTLEEDKPLLLGTSGANGNASLVMEIISGFPVCPRQDNFTILGDMHDALLQNDASLLVDGQHIPTEEFCIERVRTTIKGKQVMPAKVFACSEHAKERRVGTPARDIRFTLYPVGFIISAIFLAATLSAGWLLPASHHVLHWRCQTYHVACLMLGDICMAIIQLSADSLRGEYCQVIAILAHFFFLATFFWLNTMCFNIWWTFRDLRPASLEKGQELLRLRFYAAYAWGGPLIVAGIAAFLDHLPESPDQTFLRPRFGEKQCWFYGDMEILAYFFGPIGVLLAINLLFFAATARELTCGLWKGEFVKSTTERSRAIPRTNETARDRRHRRAALGKVCLKLVIVMGVPWIFDVISWLAGGPDFLWYLTDLLNAAQGVLIFIVVGCQPQVRAALKRLWSRNPRANANRQGNGLSTTSHGMPSMGDSVTQNPSTKTAPLETIC